ncbi:hypothetical protein GCM10020001_107990 [Nonomuraea salmonea]
MAGGDDALAECAGVQEPVDVRGLVALQHGLREAGHRVEAEPPRRPAGQEVLRAGQPAQQRLHDDQAPHEVRTAGGEQEGGRGARVDACHRGRGHTERGEQRGGVVGQGGGVVPGGGPAARAEPAQVRRDHLMVSRQVGHDVRPHLPSVREAVQQQDGGAGAGDGDVQLDAVDGDAAQLGHVSTPDRVKNGDHVTIRN